MLEQMRKGAKNVFIKAFLLLLAGFFVLWGVGDVFRGRTSNVVAKIGNSEISYGDYSNSLQREITRYQQILGRTLSEEQLKQLDIKRAILNQMIDSQLIHQRASDLNVKVGDDAAKEQLVSNSVFADETGKFSPQNFRTILKANGLNEGDYIAALKHDTAVRLLVDTLAAAPSSLNVRAEALYNYRNEERYSDLVFVPTDYINSVEEPTETDLVQFYQDHSKEFSVPETREVTYIKYGLKDVMGGIKLTDEEMKNEYEQSITSYTESEKRDVDQYLFGSEDEAKAAFAELKTDKAKNYADKKIPLGELTQESLPEELKGPVFSMAKGQFSEPVKSQLGWHIFMVNKVAEAKTKPFEEVRNEIEQYLKERKASEGFYDSTNSIEDEFAAGLSLEDVAKKFDLVIHKVPSIDSNSKGASGKAITDIPEPETFVPLVFKTDAGEVSPMTLLSDNSTYVALKVDSVVPERIKALDEVKGTAISLWKQQRKNDKLKEAAKDVAEKIKNGADPKELAKSMGLELKLSEKITRPSPDSFLDSDSGIPPQLSKEIFEKKVGESTDYYLSSDGKYVIGQLKEVRDAQMKPERMAGLRDSLRKDFTDDILRQYNYFLRNKYPIKINEALLNSASM